MTRRIVTDRLQAAEPGHEVDTFVDRIVKYIPTEIVGAWIAIKGIVGSAAGAHQQQTVLWVCFFSALILTVLYMLNRTAVPGKPPAITQTAVSTGAFVVWVLALGEPFATLLGAQNQSLYASLLLIFYTLVIGLIKPTQD